MRMGVVAGVVLLSPIIVTLHPLRTVPKRTPAAFDLPFEDVRFHTSDGLELAAWVIPHPEARGTVIFCHGHGTNRGKVAGVLTLMHDLRLNVLAFDFRGHGDSEGHTSTFGYLEVEDLIAADGLARERFPGQPILLAGVSMGAAVTLQALPRLPHVRGVWSEAAFARFGDVVDHFLTWVPPGLHAPLVRTYEGLGWLDCGFRVSAINPVDSLKETRVPIHFCHGMRDGLIPVSEGMELYASYAGPRDCWWAENATHYDVRKRNADEYRRRLRAFVDKCLATPGP
jgi:pimeloyl-ACP methyl ester carboxylesterase